MGWEPLIFDVSGAHSDDDQHQNDAAYSKSVDKNVFHLSHLLSQKVSSKQRATLALVTKLRAKVNIYIYQYMNPVSNFASSSPKISLSTIVRGF